MNRKPMQPCLPLLRRLPLPFALLFGCVSYLLLMVPAAAQQGTGAIAGAVSNNATGDLLQGAVVEIGELGLQALTNNIGEYTFRNVPAGQHQVSVSYTGLDPVRQTGSVAAGQRTILNFDLTSSVYQLEAFTVTGEREGNAASITRQRSAPNVKSVVALDALGNLPNESAGELLIRMPGIAGSFDDEGNVTGISIRGIAPGFNAVMVDGNQQASAGGFGRDFRTHNISGALFDEIEVTKSPTPDMPADSLGGSVNLRTRSSLNLKEKRRISYRAAARWAPDFYDHIPVRRDRQIHPLLSLSYQEVFGVLRGDRNLGVSASLFYSENVNTWDQRLLDYDFTTASPAYVWDFRRTNAYNNRVQQSANVRLDYRFSENTEFFFSAIYNDAPEKFDRRYSFRAFTNTRAVAAIGPNGQPTGVNPILPGYTDNRAEVRAVPGTTARTTFQLNSTQFSFLDRQRQLHTGARHTFDRLRLDYDVNYSHSKPLLQSSYRDGNAGGGVFTMDVRNIGWLFDKSQSAIEPQFTQTEGPGIFDPANYGNAQLQNRNNKRFTTFYNASANAEFSLPTTFSSSIKAGVRYRDVKIEEEANERRWNYIGTEPLTRLVDPTIEMSFEGAMGGRLPFIDSARVGTDVRENPHLWQEDVYFHESRRFIGTRSLDEEVQAAYLQGQARWGRLSGVAGLRAERTEFKGTAHTLSQPASTTAQRNADPVGAAFADYAGNRRVLSGSHTDWFPGVHLTYRFRPNLQSRLSYSNSIGRPPGTQLLPTFSVNTNAETVTLGNPNLKPQLSENWDATIEYYFEPVGQLSGGYFRKDLKDFLVTRMIGVVPAGVNNGFNGSYEGYSIMGPSNAGRAKVDGFELSYQQQFTFLPGMFRGLGVSANYTKLRTSGDYGETGARSTRDVARFTPETLNIALSYNYRQFGARILYSYMAATLWDYSTNPSRLRYRDDRELVNIGLTYRWSRAVSLSLDLTNAFNEPQAFYRALPSRLERSTFNGTTISFGVSGRF
jgi:TonB-dependent receptor